MYEIHSMERNTDGSFQLPTPGPSQLKHGDHGCLSACAANLDGNPGMNQTLPCVLNRFHDTYTLYFRKLCKLLLGESQYTPNMPIFRGAILFLFQCVKVYIFVSTFSNT